MIARDVLELFLNREVAIRKADGYTLVGTITELGDAHLLLENPEYDPRIIRFDQILEIEPRSGKP